MNEEIKKRDTVGKISTDLAQKPREYIEVGELREGVLTDFPKNMCETIEHGLKAYSGDFYIVVLAKKERLFNNLIRNYFFHRKSPPTPEYDQSVYHYNRLNDTIELMWVLPKKEACKFLKTYALLIPKEQKELLGYVLAFYNGDLLKKVKILNNEQKDSNILMDNNERHIW